MIYKPFYLDCSLMIYEASILPFVAFISGYVSQNAQNDEIGVCGDIHDDTRSCENNKLPVRIFHHV